MLASNRLNEAPSDEPRIGELWSELAAKHELDMVVCSTSALRRGILHKAEEKQRRTVSNLLPNFVLGARPYGRNFESDRTYHFCE